MRWIRVIKLFLTFQIGGVELNLQYGQKDLAVHSSQTTLRGCYALIEYMI